MTKPSFDEPHKMDELREIAKKQALEEFKEIERKALLASMLEEERAKLRPLKPDVEPDELMSITIDVPPNMFVNQANETGITIDGKMYVYGVTYQVSRALAADLNHIMYRAYHNEKAMGSPNRDMNRRKIIDARGQKVILDPRGA